MAEHGRPGGRWEYQDKPQTTFKPLYVPTLLDRLIYAAFVTLALGLVIAFGILVARAYGIF